MKNLVIMGASGIGLFIATVVGLLAMQGRLDHEGTKGIPVVHSFFPPPAESEAGEGHGDDAAAAHGDDGDDKTEEPGGEDVDLTAFRQPAPLERMAGPPVHPDTVEPGAVPVDRAATGGDGHDGEHAHGAAGGAAHDHGDDAHRSSHGDDAGRGDRYRPGQLFDFPRLEAGMSVEEVNRLARELAARRKEVELDRAALDKQRRDLEARESDIRAREANVRELMQRITQEREALLAEIRRYEQRAIVVREAERAQFDEYAARLAAMEPERASNIVLQMWGVDAEKERAVKILSVMKKTAVDEILAVVDERQSKEILDALAATVVEDGKRK